MKKMMKKLMFLTLMVLMQPAMSEVYKCKNKSGTTSFSDRPCKNGQSVVYSIKTDINEGKPHNGNKTYQNHAPTKKVEPYDFDK